MRHLALGTLTSFCTLLPLSAQDKSSVPEGSEAIEAGVKLLLDLQEKYEPDRRAPRMSDKQVPAWQDRESKRLAKLREGTENPVEWPYEGVYRVGGSIPPGYRVGGTAIVCEALVLAPGYREDARRVRAVERSIAFMLDQLDNNELLAAGPKKGYDVRGWAHSYALEFFLLCLREDVAGDAGPGIKSMVPKLLSCLEANETPEGGWNYANARCSPFMTGATLLALYQASAQGFEVDGQMVSRALDALERARSPEGSYVYSGVVPEQDSKRRRSSRTAMPGACARACIAELSLWKAGRSDATRLRLAVDAFFEHWDQLLLRKSQQGTHKGKYGIAPYYFMFGHTYAALAIESLPLADRKALRKKMQTTLWKTREADGSWNDRIFPRTQGYSIAMAVWALSAPSLEPSPVWNAAVDAPDSATPRKR